MDCVCIYTKCYINFPKNEQKIYILLTTTQLRERIENINAFTAYSI